MGLQDRALIRVLVHTGARAVDLSLILWQIDVTVFDGPIVRIRFGYLKNTYHSNKLEYLWFRQDSLDGRLRSPSSPYRKVIRERDENEEPIKNKNTTLGI
jgi:hypothetical protein